MDIRVRSERLEDYEGIAEVCAMSFTRDGRPQMGEALLVDTLRHGRRFDPDLCRI